MLLPSFLTLPTLLLLLLFVLTIGHLLSLKVCSVSLDHRTAPVFISLWTLTGLALTYPVFGHLLPEGIVQIDARPWLLVVMALKSVLLYVLLVESQSLMKVSLSSRHFVTPLAVGLMAFVNWSLGEVLTPQQWAASLGLCLLALLFLMKGHLADLGRAGRLTYAKLVLLSVLLAALDMKALKSVNWYTLLLVTNAVLLLIGVVVNRQRRGVLKAAFLSPTAAVAGLFYAATELVKFYQQVQINPVTVVVMVQACTKPVILVLSALIWKERTVKEQALWGGLVFAVFLVLIWPDRLW